MYNEHFHITYIVRINIFFHGLSFFGTKTLYSLISRISQRIHAEFCWFLHTCCVLICLLVIKHQKITIFHTFQVFHRNMCNVYQIFSHFPKSHVSSNTSLDMYDYHSRLSLTKSSSKPSSLNQKRFVQNTSTEYSFLDPHNLQDVGNLLPAFRF